MDLMHLLEEGTTDCTELSDFPPDSPDYAATFRSIAEGNPFHTASLRSLSTSKPLPPTPENTAARQPEASVPGSLVPKTGSSIAYTYSVDIKPISIKAAKILGIDTLYYLILDGTRVYVLDSSSVYRLLITFHLELPVPKSQVKQSREARIRNRMMEMNVIKRC